ncbi:hypothetical protein ACEU6E_02370 [Halorutilales archaeon Cl-col2-1]
MQPSKFIWWASEDKDQLHKFEDTCDERNWVSRHGIQDFLLSQLPGDPDKVRMEVPTDYWSDIENPHIDTAGEIDLLELEGVAHYPEKKIEFETVTKMVKDDEDPSIDWKIWKMQKKYP